MSSKSSTKSVGAKTPVVSREEREIQALIKFINSPLEKGEDLKKREDAITELGKILSSSNRTRDLHQITEIIRPFLDALGNAKAARIIRDMIDLCLKTDQDADAKILLVEESIEWANAQNYVYLRQALQSRLIGLLNDLGRYTQSLQRAEGLVRELKKIDDKDLLLEVLLEESKACYYLSNLAKSRVALTSARAISNSTYVPPIVQARLDMQSGILHAADERDFKTAFSYFYEAFEGFDSVDKPVEATLALKYMLLSKIMLDGPEDINQLLGHKNAVKYCGKDIIAMQAIGTAAKNRSLKQFNEAFGQYRDELQSDLVVFKHFSTLGDAMAEKELCRLVEPYSFVQIQYIANAIGLPARTVEEKLAVMLLDKKICGSLDQDNGTLAIYDRPAEEKTSKLIIQTVRALSKFVETIYAQAQKL